MNRFNRPSLRTKESLRDKYGVEQGKFVLLHVGPIIRKRNIERLSALQDADTIILIIGREGADPSLRAELRHNGFQIFDQYLANIQDIYALSDCYVFPTCPANRGASIEIPLSVLEAMASDLPIVSTAFGALQRIFDDGDGFFFAETTNDMRAHVEEIRRGNTTVSTRRKVLPYSWGAVSRTLEERYNELIR
jgi:glycosyltransferase involved in cell wall biosynthesis